MKNDWQLNLSESEYEILGKCAQRGKYLAIIFASSLNKYFELLH